MPTGITASDRKLLIGAGALLLLLLAAGAVLTPPAEEFNSPVPSTYSSQSGGAAAAYRLLARLHYPVRRWENPPTELNTELGHVLLILAEPTQPPSDNERKALADFVTDGGHVLFTGANIRDYFAAAETSSEQADPKFISFRPTIPSRLTRDAEHVSIQPSAYWRKLSPEQLELYGNESSAVVVSWAKGQGEILWWAGSTPLTNAGITREDNLAFFLSSMDNWTAKDSYKIYWDEYFHGQRSSLWSYVGKTSLAWSVFQVAALALAVFFTFSRRSGPTYVPVEVSRLSPLEFVDTLGGLYERAGAASSALAVSYFRLRTLLTRQLSLPANSQDGELAQTAEQRLGWGGSGLPDALRRAGAARRVEKLAPREALKLVQELEEFAAKLNIGGQVPRGKT
jgi:hypothetical protein